MKRTALLLGVAFTAICMCAPFLWRVSSSAVAFSPEKVFMDSVEKLENTLDILWNCSHSGPIPAGFEKFDEHQDPIYALAEAALTREISNSKHAKYLAKERADSKAKEEHALYITQKEKGGEVKTSKSDTSDEQEAS